GEVPAWERVPDGGLEEREERDASRELMRGRRLRDRELERDLDCEDGQEREWHPPVGTSRAPADDRDAERDRPDDLALSEDRDRRPRDIEPRRVRDLYQVEDCPIERTQPAGGDKAGERDE